MFRTHFKRFTISTSQTQANANGLPLIDVRILCKQGCLNEALNILRFTDNSADSSTYVSLLEACIRDKALPEAKIVHAHINQIGIKADSLLHNALIKMYVKCEKLADACRVFNRMPQRDECSWTLMMAAYARHGFPEEALSLFHQMKQEGVHPDQFTFSSVLPACAELASLEHGKQIHKEIIERGYHSNVFVMSALVDMYAKCGCLEKAREVFDNMPERNVVSWTAMIAAYSRQGLPEKALALFRQMRETSVQANSLTFTNVVQACASLASLEKAFEIHEEIIRDGFQSDVVVISALVDMYAKCGSIETARIMFDKISKPDVVSWTVMIAGYAQAGHLSEALKFFEKMPQRDIFSWTAMISGYAQNGLVDEALKLFNEMPERNVVSWNAMIAGFAQNGRIGEALKLFKEMPQLNVASWNAMIAGFAQNGYGDEALKCFQEMQLAGVKPDWKTFTSILPVCANLINLEHGVEIHDKIIKSGLQSDAFVVSALVNMYANCGSLHKARELFDKMYQPDVVVWTSMIAGYAQSGFTEEALKLFNKMPQRDAVAWTTMIAGYAQNGLVDEALNLFNEMPRRDAIAWNAMIAGFVQNEFIDEAMNLFEMMPQKNIFSWTAIISGFAQSGCVDEALKHFKEMPERTVASWNAIIAGFSQNGHGEEALRLFQQMQLADVRLYPKTFASILPACANLAALEQGMEIHENIIRSGFESDVTVMNALIDMYGKCGNIKKAHHLFGKMHQQNVVSWTTIIAVYAMHGCGKEAIKLFEQMKLSGINPNHITFVNILSACSHAGLVDEGFQYFRSMIEDYHITPGMEHYRCMVDLLGRAGCLDEAHTFINKMPIKPDASLWSCLLSACRVHNNTELGERIAEYILDFDPENTAPYVLLSNIYAMAGRWDDIEKVRKMMKDRGIQKAPGCSWIEINKQVHAFLMGDK